MRRQTLLAAVATLAIAVSAPSLAGSHSYSGASRSGSDSQSSGGYDQSQPADAAPPADSGQSTDGDKATETKTDSDTKVRTHSRIRDQLGGSVSTAKSKSSKDSSDKDSSRSNAVTDGMTVVDGSGATVGTVTGLTAEGKGGGRTVQVTLTGGKVITLTSKDFSVDGDVLVATKISQSD